MNCWFVPNAIEGFAGVSAIDTRAALVTVRVVDPVIAPELAPIVVVPVPVPVARPAVEIVATPWEDELQVTVPVMFCVLPSVYVPVAVNCFALPNGIEGTAGVTLIETRVAGVTVKTVEPTIDPRVAVIVVCPVATLPAIPTVGAVLPIVATAGTELLQTTELVMFSVLPSV